MSDGGPEAGANRRQFLKAAAAGSTAAGAMMLSPSASAAEKAAPSKMAPPTPKQAAMERQPPTGYNAEQLTEYFVERPGSDIMVDIIKSVGIPYVAINSGSSFRGLHESINNYGGNRAPEIITCLHEEQAAGIAHGYAKASGKLMAVLCHGTVGIQHAAMAVYNAYADRAPMIILAAHHGDAKDRLSQVHWAHSAQDPISVIRDYIKWDDAPQSLPSFAESFVRAVKIAMTPPMGPVALVLDSHLQEEEAKGHEVHVPKLSRTTPPMGDTASVKLAAQMLVAAQNPLLMADRLANTSAGMTQLVTLAELLQAPVVDAGGRMNFPTDHYLNHSFLQREVVPYADVIVGFDMEDIAGVITGGVDRNVPEARRNAADGVKVVTIGVNDLTMKSNFQTFNRYYPSDLSIAGDGEATLTLLIEEVRRAMTPARRNQNGARKAKLAAAYQEMRRQALEDARYGWSGSPVSTARLSMELWSKIRSRDWALTVDGMFQSFWPQRLWDINKHHQYIGRSGAYGVGYGAAASVGAALEHREHKSVAVNIQSDGDFMYVPGTFWTAAHHNIPLLTVMHNNGGYHQETMHLQRMASRRNRGLAGSAAVGNAFTGPSPDYAQIAKGMGVWSAGPFTGPDDLGAAIGKALEVVAAGEPALVDVVCQPR